MRLAALALACLPALTQNRAEEAVRLLRPSRTPPDGRINAKDKTWEEWVRRTGEQPPDFDAMPSVPDLPDPLIIREGKSVVNVTTPALWNVQKKLLRDQVEKWMFGRMPPAPGNVRATVTASRKEGGATVREVTLAFGPGHRATLRIELVIPEGKGPFPVFLTNHARNRPWIYTAVRRGYIACIYHATDPRYGNGDDSDAWIEIYPEFDFSCLARWAWAASRAIDYLETVPEADRRKIGLTGHSRNGKQALVAAAFDERIGAVIPSSGNSGECDPWRYTTEPFANESVELLAGAQAHWFHPRLRFFSGREDKLPVDQNTLLSLVAPRGLMLYSGYAESAGNPLGFEQGYRSALRVYEMLGKSANIWLHLRDGEHDTTAGDIENFVDFFDAVFGRKPRPKTETWIFGYTWDGWKKTTGSVSLGAAPVRGPAPETGVAARKRIEWALGEEPPGLPRLVSRELPSTAGSSESWLAGLFGRPSANPALRASLRARGIGWAELPYGDGLKADIFYPASKPKGPWPVAVFLHAYTYQGGWSISAPWASTGADFRLDQRPSFPSLIERGFAVVAFDQIGFGTRVHDAREFYARYPRWSLMGKMVADTRAVVDAVAALETVDPSRIHLFGYSLGAKVGLIATALDPRVKSLAAVCGFESLRRGTPDRGVEGIRHYSHIHGLMPKLGFFLGREERLPLDFDEVLALAAPRRVLIVAPTLDRYARLADVKTGVEAARAAWREKGRAESLELDTPEGFNSFYRPVQEKVFDWLARSGG